MTGDEHCDDDWRPVGIRTASGTGRDRFVAVFTEADGLTLRAVDVEAWEIQEKLCTREVATVTVDGALRPAHDVDGFFQVMQQSAWEALQAKIAAHDAAAERDRPEPPRTI